MGTMPWKQCSCSNGDVCEDTVYTNGYCKRPAYRNQSKKEQYKEMVGDTVIDGEGNLFEIVWAGGEGLIGPRETKSTTNTPTKRLYNKKSDYWNRKSSEGDQTVDNPETITQDSGTKE